MLRAERAVSESPSPPDKAKQPEPVTEGASYVQLSPEGWAWYRLQTLEQGKYELCLVQTSIPEFTFECLRLDDATSGNAEAEFSTIINERGLLYVDASPNIPRRWCSEIAEILQELKAKKSALDRNRAMCARWLEMVARALGFSGSESGVRSLEAEIEVIRTRLREACFQADEDGGDESQRIPETLPESMIQDRIILGQSAPVKLPVRKPRKAATKKKEVSLAPRAITSGNSSDCRERLAALLNRLTASHPEHFKILAGLRDVPFDTIGTADMPVSLREALEVLHAQAIEKGFLPVDHETVAQFLSRFAGIQDDKKGK